MAAASWALLWADKSPPGALSRAERLMAKECTVTLEAPSWMTPSKVR